MGNVYISYKFVRFLYAYLRQADLSLDRSRWGSWHSLREYYNEQISPSVIASYLNKELTVLPLNKELKIFFKIKQFILYFANIDSCITKSEALTCIQLLREFDRFLKEGTSYNIEIEKLRVDIASFYLNILKSKLLIKDVNKAMAVEHYFQNPILNVASINEFIQDLSFLL